MTDNKKLFCVTLKGHYSMSYGWDDGWNISSIYPCTMDGNIARFTVRDRDFECKIDSGFVDRWGGYVDCLRDNAGSRSADVYVWADDADSAKAKAHDVIMRFSPPTTYYKKGKWIFHLDNLFPKESTQECSVCHEEEFITIQNDNFCPNCGADMRGS